MTSNSEEKLIQPVSVFNLEITNCDIKIRYILALPIHTSPELTGESAELFVKEAENRPVTLGKLTKKEEHLLERVERSTKEFKAKIFRDSGVWL